MADPGTDRGVSDVLGYILVFSLIAASVGLVSVVGFEELQGARDAERIQNAERAFDVLGDNVEDVYRGGAPSRATELQLSDATLGFGGTTTVTVTVGGTTFTRTLTPLVYEAADTQIVYEAGAVIRTDRVGARMVREPALLVTDDAAAIQIVRTAPDTERSLGGETTVLVRTTRTNTAVLDRSSGQDVSIEIETTAQRAPAWKRYFDETETDIGDCAVSGDTVTCPGSGSYTPADVSVTSTRVVVQLVP